MTLVHNDIYIYTQLIIGLVLGLLLVRFSSVYTNPDAVLFCVVHFVVLGLVSSALYHEISWEECIQNVERDEKPSLTACC